MLFALYKYPITVHERGFLAVAITLARVIFPDRIVAAILVMALAVVGTLAIGAAVGAVVVL